jgi:protocatechuate 3,4-dioxygenase beta subunit
MHRQWLALLFFPAVGAAQTGITGTVVDRSTGLPIPGARVVANCPQPLFATTDAAGMFDFAGLRPPRCHIDVDHAGFLSRKQPIQIQRQDKLISVRIAMTAGAVITGKVMDENGWPLPSSWITLARYKNDSGPPTLESCGRFRSDELGRYRIGSLPPGRYYLHVQPRLYDYLPAWYPGELKFADARPIDAQEGQAIPNADFRLTLQQGVEVRGRATLPSGVRPNDCYINVLYTDVPQNLVGSMALAPDGSFRYRHLTPGRYRITAVVGYRPDETVPPTYMASRTLEVRDANIDNLVLNVGPTILRDLKGAIVSDGPVIPERVHVTLHRARSNSPITPSCSLMEHSRFRMFGLGSIRSRRRSLASR